MHNPIPDAIRTKNAKTILSYFPAAVQPADLQRTALFALTPNGAADDIFVLGPYSRPSIIHAISFTGALDPATTRTFAVYFTTEATAGAVKPSDVNILDPLSPSSTWMPSKYYTTIPIGRLAPFPKFWLKLLRFKGGSITFELTVWIHLRQVP